jgi:hypothetical protein
MLKAVRARALVVFVLAVLPLVLASSVGDAEEQRVAAVSPVELRYIQYGVALTAEVVTIPGPICSSTTAPCILGSGGGIAARVGYRFPGSWYVGGAYEFSKQDPSQLYRLAILQQLRGEARYYVITKRVTEPYLAAGLGVVGYGNAWGVDMWGALAYLGVGAEVQLSRTKVIGFGLSYRLLYTQRFTDSSATNRDPGIAQLFGVDIVLEARDPL